MQQGKGILNYFTTRNHNSAGGHSRTLVILTFLLRRRRYKITWVQRQRVHCVLHLFIGHLLIPSKGYSQIRFVYRLFFLQPNSAILDVFCRKKRPVLNISLQRIDLASRVYFRIFFGGLTANIDTTIWDWWELSYSSASNTVFCVAYYMGWNRSLIIQITELANSFWLKVVTVTICLQQEVTMLQTFPIRSYLTIWQSLIQSKRVLYLKVETKFDESPKCQYYNDGTREGDNVFFWSEVA